jgi:hypothetical protein
VDSDNLYAFNGFDPVNFADPWGLEMGGVAEVVDVGPPPPGWEYVEVTSTSATVRRPDFGVAKSRALAEAKFEARQGGHALALFDVPVEPPPVKPVGRPPGAVPRFVPGGPRQPIRPHPVLLGVGLGLAVCDRIPQCAENLRGIITEGKRLARAVGERLSGAEKPPSATPTRPPTLEPKTLPEVLDPMAPDAPAAADAPDEAPQPAADGAGAQVPPTRPRASVRSDTRVPAQGVEVETIAPGPVKPSAATDRWDEFLGSGPHTNIHPRTGVPDPNRLVSADGKRSIRYGPHEMNSSPAKHHYHEETWSMNPATNAMDVQNTVVRVPRKP